MRRAKPPGEQQKPREAEPLRAGRRPGRATPPVQSKAPRQGTGSGTWEKPDPSTQGQGKGNNPRRLEERRQGQKPPGRFQSGARFEDYSDEAEENHQETSTGLKSITVVQKPNLTHRLTGGWRSNSQPAGNRKSWRHRYTFRSLMMNSTGRTTKNANSVVWPNPIWGHRVKSNHNFFYILWFVSRQFEPAPNLLFYKTFLRWFRWNMLIIILIQKLTAQLKKAIPIINHVLADTLAHSVLLL